MTQILNPNGWIPLSLNLFGMILKKPMGRGQPPIFYYLEKPEFLIKYCLSYELCF